MVGDIGSLLSIETAGGADKYLSPPASGDVVVMSENHLVDSITSAAVASLRGKAPQLPVALFNSGKNLDVSTILRVSDGACDCRREFARFASSTEGE